MNGYNDIAELRRLREMVDGLDPQGTPVAVELVGPVYARRLAFLAGSFNPLTRAHIRLAREALRALALSTVYFLVSKIAVDKELPDGAMIEDRLMVLQEYAAANRHHGVVICNKGLYVEQAAALQRAFPGAGQLLFIAGYDKLVQIIDPRYYADRDAALATLFTKAQLVVAARSGQEAQAFEELMARPENRAYRRHIRFLPFPRRLQALSSSAMRQRLATGRIPAALLPRQTIDFVSATAAYLPPIELSDGEKVDRYDLRARLVAAMRVDRPGSVDSASFLSWLRLLWSDSIDGRELRRWMSCGHTLLNASLPTMRSEHHGYAS